MSTDIAVRTTATLQTEKRNWLWGPHGTEPGDTPNIVLDLSAFVAATHFPNGHIPSGTVLGRVTATGLYVPYNDAFDADAVTAGQQGDGREVAAGLLFSSVTVPSGATRIGAALFVHGLVKASKLPIAAGNPGALDAAARVDLRLIHFGA